MKSFDETVTALEKRNIRKAVKAILDKNNIRYWRLYGDAETCFKFYSLFDDSIPLKVYDEILKVKGVADFKLKEMQEVHGYNLVVFYSKN
jgi:hypothetical protein